MVVGFLLGAPPSAPPGTTSGGGMEGVEVEGEEEATKKFDPVVEPVGITIWLPLAA